MSSNVAGWEIPELNGCFNGKIIYQCRHTHQRTKTVLESSTTLFWRRFGCNLLPFPGSCGCETVPTGTKSPSIGALPLESKIEAHARQNLMNLMLRCSHLKYFWSMVVCFVVSTNSCSEKSPQIRANTITRPSHLYQGFQGKTKNKQNKTTNLNLIHHHHHQSAGTHQSLFPAYWTSISGKPFSRTFWKSNLTVKHAPVYRLRSWLFSMSIWLCAAICMMSEEITKSQKNKSPARDPKQCGGSGRIM